ncbi:MAG: rpsD small subunit ribosomal protein [Candidatus Parcubacteria bacterium]|jgi:small subunit ribosomal protein S4
MYSRKKVKICRKFGEKIFPEVKISEEKLAKAPGVHGAKRRRSVSEFGKQLQEKQKVKYVYGLREKQFRRFYEKALIDSEPTPTALLRILESRLDNAVYRAQMAGTREQARQMILHGHILVNGKKVTISSFIVKPGDVISYSSTKSKLVAEYKERLKDSTLPSWLTLDKKSQSIEVAHTPGVEELSQNFDIALVIQYYSR